jgi:hypothetical protein
VGNAQTGMNSLPALSEEAKHDAAHQIATKLLRAAEGDVNAPATWLCVATTSGCALLPYHEPFTGLGKYIVESRTIAYNTATEPATIARVLVHELSHDQLLYWIPPQLHNALDVYCYGDDPEDIRHQIARLVEELIFPEELPVI